MVGKWRLGYAPDQTRRAQILPTRQGFDEYLGLPYSNDMIQSELFLIENETPIESMGASWSDTGVNQHKLIWRYTERALDFIGRNQDRPFFLYIAQSMPHVPVHPSKTTFANADGKNLWPVLSGQSGAVSPHSELYYYSGSTIHAVRQGPWKFRRVSGTKLLYNLDSDIQERSNRLSEEPGLGHARGVDLRIRRSRHRIAPVPAHRGDGVRGYK